MDGRSNDTTHVFVYGTLLSGECNHHILAGARLIGPANTPQGHELVHLGSFPAMTEAGTGMVHGEVYVVNAETLRELDKLEGHPDFYRREWIVLDDGREVQTYLMDGSKVEGYPRIASCNWRTRSETEE